MRSIALDVQRVPAYQACAVPNSTHGAPLGFASCNPPVQSSPNLTVVRLTPTMPHPIPGGEPIPAGWLASAGAS